MNYIIRLFLFFFHPVLLTKASAGRGTCSIGFQVRPGADLPVVLRCRVIAQASARAPPPVHAQGPHRSHVVQTPSTTESHSDCHKIRSVVVNYISWNIIPFSPKTTKFQCL